jgi:aminodeoxychorismate synthase component I
MRPLTAWGRFDDLQSGTAWNFPDIAYDLVALEARDVPAVLAEVELAARSGWWAFGFVAYEAAAGFDTSLTVHEPVDDLPLAWFGVCAAPEMVPVVRPHGGTGYHAGDWTCQWDAARHACQVEAVRRHIAAGETYQCNLTTRMTGQVRGELSRFYADLAHGQGGAYNAYLDLGRFAIASASPELFFRTTGEEILMRPMKGTARRGLTEAQDAEIVSRLRASAKERAENIMIVDLVRNDIARIAVTGSVSVTALCRAERYETVHQLTSDVTARMRPGTHLTDVFGALFPCGSVTGAPKPRTMRLIRELEDGPRGVYCGAIGMVSPPETPDAPVQARFNVAIRTLVADRDSGTATYGTGGGITWDSCPGEEYAELRAKTAVLTSRA